MAIDGITDGYAATDGQGVTSHFWIASTPYFQTSLFFVPNISNFLPNSEEHRSERKSYLSRINLFDADGTPINEIETEFPLDRVGVLELEPLLEMCKYEGGLRHGRAMVIGNNESRALCRLYGRDNGVYMGELTLLNERNRAFFPLTLAEAKTTILVASNFTSQPTSLKLKLIIGKRSPEMHVDLAAGATRLINLEAEFPEFTELNLARTVQGYLRLSTRSDDTVGVQLIERLEGPKDSSIFVTVT